MVKTSEKIKN